MRPNSESITIKVTAESADAASPSEPSEASEPSEEGQVPTTKHRWSARRVIYTAQASQLFLWILMIAVVLSILLPAILLQGPSRLFLLKVILAPVLAWLPGWIYLLFIKNKGQSLYDEYVLNLFRLKIDTYGNLPAPPQHMTYFEKWDRAHKRIRDYSKGWLQERSKPGDASPTKDNLYRKKFEAVYGRGSVSTFEMIYGKHRWTERTETFSPVLVATALLCLGWSVVLPPDFFGLMGLGRGSDSFFDLPYEALKFGFIGAYAFTIQDLIRRYFRDDLKAAAYIPVVVRVIFVSLIVVSATLLPEESLGTSVNMAAFVIGFFPQAGLQLLFESVRWPLGKLIPSLRTPHPLTWIDGLTIWHEARLAEEGIDDMEHLASANMVDLVLRTRSPIGRLIDWMDQALLHLRVLPLTSHSRKPDREAHWKAIQALAALGIRSATDLQRSWDKLQTDPHFVGRISSALNLAPDEGRAVFKTILAGLDSEANFWHVMQFRKRQWLDDAQEPGGESRPHAA